MATVAEIKKLIEDEEIDEAMRAIWVEVFEESSLNDLEIDQLKALRAWCHCEREEYADARQWAESAGDVQLARECLVRVVAHEKKSSIPILEESVRLWEKQVESDPTNPLFQERLENARKRLDEVMRWG